MLGQDLDFGLGWCCKGLCGRVSCAKDVASGSSKCRVRELGSVFSQIQMESGNKTASSHMWEPHI
jgi:hypothetical protein